MGLILKGWLACGVVVMVPFLLVAAYLFLFKAKGTWRERLRMFGGGT